MKQVKKLLVILPLVALFVLGSLPVFAVTPTADQVITARDELEQMLDAAVRGETDPAQIDKGKYGISEDDAKNIQTLIDGNDNSAINSLNDTELEQLKKEIDDFKALFVKGTRDTTGNTPGNNTTKPEAQPVRSIIVKYSDRNTSGHQEAERTYTLPADWFTKTDAAALEKDKDGKFVANYSNITKLAGWIKRFVESQLQDGFEPVENTYEIAAESILNGGGIKEPVEVLLSRDTLDYSHRVVAYDIHNGEYVFDRLYKVDMRPGFDSYQNISEAFYQNTQTLKDHYLYVGFATRRIQPVLLFRAAYLERFANQDYIDVLDQHYAELVVFVVPNSISITVEHVFPAGTRTPLRETVPVPYETWASLQNSWTFMDLPNIFKTRIQKVNEMGFAYNHVEYFNGHTPITGLLQSYDWFNHRLGGEGDDSCVARVFYDKAVAAAKEVPTEKKVDAATAPQAQIKAPAAQAPVTAANTTTTTAPVNTLPVTGASDSIFLFLSSAALMAVGILFFKKH